MSSVKDWTASVIKQAEIDKLSQATQNTEVRSEIDGVIQKIDTSKMGGDDSEGVEDTLTEGTTDPQIPVPETAPAMHLSRS